MTIHLEDVVRMILLILAFLVSLVPAIGLFLWLRKVEGDETFENICNKALVQGMLSALPIVGCSAVLALLEMGLHVLVGFDGVARTAYHNFFVLAFSEELFKYLWFRRLLDRHDRAWSWFDYIILMTIVGIGFGLIEDVPYAFVTNPIQMLVRGLDVGHGGYGFIMGYFMGKGKKTGKKAWSAVGFVLPWLLHGLYDFTLAEDVDALSEIMAIIPVTLAVISVATIIFLIVFVNRHRNDRTFREPFAQA